ncbi:hypothetical protein F441_01693 [Phytophthora nicotianae CJ01A1]|uniref:Uncharacterized protein n=2 Tax=Phytophthora nicotianae TaxID=4792 RepID=W2XRD2_PHYNI|nr:hypothetical protein L916_01623 [Phytophthora nicotianae]ETP25425.1 hypothetical protein F441_01693 [Phytophthora nicotianae CJ01A1]
MARAKGQDVSGVIFGGPAICYQQRQNYSSMRDILTDDQVPKLIARCEKATSAGDNNGKWQLDSKYV